MPDQRIGFVGLGDMGEPMAACILAAGYPVVSCANRRREAIEALKARGLEEVDSPVKVGELSDILITCVMDAAQTDTVLRGPDGALASLAAGTIIVLTSTLSPAYCQALAEEAAAQGIAVLDCPVSGARVRAETGDLALICGGEVETFERCRPVLETMGKPNHCGPIGTGQVAKLVNQGLLYGIIRMLQEGRALAKAYDLDPDTLMKVLSQSTGNTTAGENWEMLVRIWPHADKIGIKDLGLIAEAARAKGVEIPMIESRRDISWEMEPDA